MKGKRLLSILLTAVLLASSLCLPALAAEGDATPGAGFTDVADGAWYREAVDYVVSEGLFEGLTDEHFAPGASMSRAMTATVLWRMAGSPASAGADSFSDISDDAWYREAVLWASETGVMEGRSDGRFDPDAAISRQELITVLWRREGRHAGARQALERFSDRSDIAAYAEASMAWALTNGLVEGYDGRLSPRDKCSRAQVASILMRLGQMSTLSSHALIATGIDSAAKADAVAAVENLGGLFMYYYNANQLGKAAALFDESAPASLRWSAEDAQLQGAEEIAALFQTVQARRAQEDRLRDIHLLVSPIFEVSEDGGTAYASWDTYSYQVRETDGAQAVETYTTRVDMCFVKDAAGSWKIRDMAWLEMLSFQPKVYDLDGHGDYVKLTTALADMAVPAVGGKSISGADFVAIEQVQNLFTQNNRAGAEALFSRSAGASLYLGNLAYTADDLFGGGKAVIGYESIVQKLQEMRAAEAENGYDFLSIPFMTTPVLQLSADGNTAYGSWLAQTVDVKAGYYGGAYNSLFDENGEKDMDAQIDVVRSICMLSQKFVRENGEWKILEYSVEPILSLPVDSYRWANIAGFGHHSMQNADAETSFPYIALDNSWAAYDDGYDYTLASAADTKEIQGFIARWANANKRQETLVFLDTLMANGNDNLYLFMKNSSSVPQLGYDGGVFAFMQKQTRNWNQTLSIGHSGTTPLVYTYTDAQGTQHAIGYWIDHSWTNLAQVFGLDVTMPEIDFMVNLNRYRHEFVKENGEWKMLGFGFEPLIELPKWKFTWAGCRGWGSLGLGALTGTDSSRLYPQSFDLLRDDVAPRYF